MAGYSYDALGNVTNDGFHTYTYDADNNVTSVDSGSTGTYSYDSLNQRFATKTSAGSYELVFDAQGKRVSTWVAGTHAFSEAVVYADATPVAFRRGGATHFQHQDYLGTERVRTGYSGAVEGTFSSLPFGDNYVATGSDSDWYHYGGTDHDSESSTEHATFRQLSSTEGRWMSPDPYYGSYDPTNPQSLNRYSYVLNDPLKLFDPLGLDYDSGSGCFISNEQTIDQDTGKFENTETAVCDGGGGGGVYVGGGNLEGGGGAPNNQQNKKNCGQILWDASATVGLDAAII